MLPEKKRKLRQIYFDTKLRKWPKRAKECKKNAKGEHKVPKCPKAQMRDITHFLDKTA